MRTRAAMKRPWRIKARFAHVLEKVGTCGQTARSLTAYDDHTAYCYRCRRMALRRVRVRRAHGSCTTGCWYRAEQWECEWCNWYERRVHLPDVGLPRPR